MQSEEREEGFLGCWEHYSETRQWDKERKKENALIGRSVLLGYWATNQLMALAFYAAHDIWSVRKKYTRMHI